MSNDYGTSPQAYLARARRCLERGTKEGLFHAAFELRCCVEARLAEYFELCESLAGKRLQMHKATDNQRTINAITSGDVISSITFRLSDGTILRQFHTPVPASLQAYVKRGIDHLRHAQRVYRPADDIWWSETKAELLNAYRAAWITCRGEMPLPPLWNADTGEMHPVHVLFNDSNQAALQRFSDPRNMFMEIEVDRFDEPPVDWVCDL